MRRRLAPLRCAQHLCLAPVDKEELEKRGARDSSLAPDVAKSAGTALTYCGPCSAHGAFAEALAVQATGGPDPPRSPDAVCCAPSVRHSSRTTPGVGWPLRIQTRGRRDRRPRIELSALSVVAATTSTTVAAAVHDALRHDASLRAPFAGAEGSARPAGGTPRFQKGRGGQTSRPIFVDAAHTPVCLWLSSCCCGVSRSLAEAAPGLFHPQGTGEAEAAATVRKLLPRDGHVALSSRTPA
ncbi:hypothetical protein MTO96_009128 [Rhipicephalus appendiculatus]